MDATAEKYANEPVRYPALHVVDLAGEGAAVTEPYRNMVISRINDSCLRLAVFNEAYRWHYHPASDELFVVVEGCLAIDLADQRELRLGPWQWVTIPAMTRHRTRALGRTVNLCFEKLGAETLFVESPWALAHGLLAITPLPASGRELWGKMFDRYVFRTDADPAPYLPPDRRGILGPLFPALEGYMSAQLIRSLAKRLPRHLREQILRLMTPTR